MASPSPAGRGGRTAVGARACAAARHPVRAARSTRAADLDPDQLTAREAATGDLCVLLASSRPLDDGAAAFLARLRQEHGGHLVDPLHVTIDRIATPDEDAIRRAVKEIASRIRPTRVRVGAIFGLRSKNRGSIVKLDVPREPGLDRLIDAVKSALRAAGPPSLYGPERWATVTALERVDRPASDAPRTLPAPVQLFVGDTLLLSRIAGPARYEILETASIPRTG